MEKYLFRKEFNGRYCLIEDKTDEYITRKYCVDYPSTNDDDDLNWSFFFIEVNETDYECRDWNVSTEEQEKIKNHIRTVLKPDDLREYVLTKYYDYSYLVKHPSFANDECHIVYYPHYEMCEGCNPGVRANWVFEIQKVPENENAENEYYEWIPTTYEKEYIMEFVRKEKPEDFVDFMFEPWCEGGYAVYKENISIDPNTNGTNCYIVEYPIKGNSEWYFSITTEDKDGYAETSNWNLEENKKEYIKEYIRNVLKPSDLYESEGKEMENNKNMICTGLRLPSENYKTVMEIAKKFGCEEDETVYMQLEQTPNLIQELEVCKNDKEIITKEWNKTKEILNNNMDEARTVMIELLEFITTNNGDNGVLEPTIKTLTEKIGENAISKFELEDYLPKENKYDVVTIDVTQIRTRTIEAVVPHDNYSESDIDNFIKGECSNSLDDTFNDVDEYEYEFNTHSSYDSNLTAKEIVRRYGLDGLFPGTSDIEDEVF